MSDTEPLSSSDEMGEQLQELEVEVVTNQTQLLADFACGTPTNNAGFKYSFYQNSKNKSHKRAICETSNIRYWSDSETSDVSKNYLNKYVAIVNKKTSKIKIYNAEVLRFYPLHANDDDVPEEVAREKAMQKSERDERSFYEKNDMLTEAFGSKRKQKMMVTRLSNNVSNASTAITEAVEDMIGMGKDFTAIETEEETLFNCNYEASKPEDVYKFNDIIPEDIRKACLDEAMCLMDPQRSEVEQWKKDNELRGKPYISWHAMHTHSAVRANEAIHHEYICCLQLMIYLATAYKYRKSKSTPALRHLFQTAHKAVETWLTNNFTIDGAAMPQRCKDKLLATAIIVAWHIDSFQFDLQMMADLFGLPTKKLTFIVRALGGIVKNLKKGEVATSFAVLKIPVVKPKSHDEIKKRGGRRGR